MSNDCSSGVAAVLSLVIPGAGQICKGKIGIGLFWLFIVSIGYYPFIFPGIILHIICVFNAHSMNSHSNSYNEEYQDFSNTSNNYGIQTPGNKEDYLDVCNICGKELIGNTCISCKKINNSIKQIINNINNQLNLFDKSNNTSEKEAIRVEIIANIKKLKKNKSRTFQKLIKKYDILSIEKQILNIEKQILNYNKILEHSQNILELLENAEKYNFIKDLEKERLSIAEVLYLIKKNNINNDDFTYLKTENKDKNIEESYFSIEYLKNRSEYLEEILDIN